MGWTPLNIVMLVLDRCSPDPITRRRSAPSRPIAAALVVFAVLVGLGAAACSGESGPVSGATTSTTLFATPTESVPVVTLPAGFVLPDTRGVALLPVDGKSPPVPPVEVTGGRARLSGTITGPDGPVPGATVRVERVVDGRVGSITIAAGGDGRYVADNIQGGHYRVRAWLQPNLATSNAGVAFLAADGTATVDVTTERYEGRRLQAVLDRASWSVGDTATVRALLSEQSVNGDGVVVGVGVAAAEVSLDAGDGIDTSGSSTANTDSSGYATFNVVCAAEGGHSLAVSSGDLRASVNVPSCAPATTSTTTTTPTSLDIPPFPVGSEFNVPFAGPVPPGTYRTFLTGCSTTYQVYVDGQWQSARRTATGSQFVLDVPARDFRASSGTDGCSYQRSA